MAFWFLVIGIDLGIRAETVEAAQNILDRLSTIEKNTTQDFNLYQLSCFVCLLIACKTLESKHFFKQSEIRKLGREYYTQAELDHMELNILYSLKWHIQPTSSIEISGMLLDMVHDLGLVPDYEDIKPKVVLHLIGAMVDSRFLPFKKSSIALAAVLSVLKPFLKDESFQVLQKHFEDILTYAEIFEDELKNLQAMMMAPHVMNMHAALPSMETTPSYPVVTDMSTELKYLTFQTEFFLTKHQEGLQAG
jgi:Cyclin, N-terminal domain